ncbi:MAG: hypothetical protein KIT72_08020 [Polyangiaceae bacterium]|nr:hypothetical protein [Polyangiaceae bacterium]MCW5790352.1 hypothetical protein [Polyangiaceae bacterium]
MRVRHYRVSAEAAPVDFFADPDGDWSYEALIEAAGIHPGAVPPGVLIGALARPWRGHPEGAAIVSFVADERPRLCVVEHQGADQRAA